MAKGRQSINDAVAITEPTEMDILCSKDKSVAKHPGNVVFRERIERGTVPYVTAANKQEKMKITRDIVTAMQSKYGSRFLKQKGDAWVEINNQMARDKVSHALRFAAKNLPGNNNNSKSKKINKISQCKDSMESHYSTEDESSHSGHSSVASEGPIAKSLGDEAASAPLPSIFMLQQNILTHLQSNTDEGQLDFHRFQAMSLGPLHLPPQNPEFNTLRSEDLDELLREPMFASGEAGEWEAVEQMAEC